MFNIADLIVLLLVGVTTFIGYKRGFVKTAFGMLSFLIAVIIATTFYKLLATQLINNTKIDDWIYDTISQKIEDNTVDSNDRQLDDSIFILENLPEKIKDELDIEGTKTRAKSFIAEKAVNIGMNLISFVIIYVVSRIGLIIACFALDLVAKLPVLKQANEILGLIFGAFQGLFSVFTALAIIMLLTSVLNMEWLLGYIKGSLIASILYENNFIIWLLF